MFQKYKKQHFEIDERMGHIIHRNQRDDKTPRHVYRLKDLVYRETGTGAFKIQATCIAKSVLRSPSSSSSSSSSSTSTSSSSSSSSVSFTSTPNEFMEVVNRRTFFLLIEDHDVARLWKIVMQRHGAQEVHTGRERHRIGNAMSTTSPFLSEHLFGNLDDDTLNASRLRIEIEVVYQWNVVDVQNFLSCLRLPMTSLARGRRAAKERTFFDRYGKLFLKNDVSGAVMMGLNDESMQSIGILLQQDRMELQKSIKVLEETKVFDINEHFILQKLEEMEWNIVTDVKGGDILTLIRHAQLRKKYFNFDAIDRETLQQNLDIEKASDDECFSLPVTEPNVDLMKLGTTELNYLEDDNAEFSVGLAALCFSCPSRKQSNKAILLPTAGYFPSFVTATEEDDEGIMRGNGSNNNSNNKKKKNGSHESGTDISLAVVFGPFLLQWNDTCLVVPKRMVHSMTLIQNYVLPLKKIPREQINDAISKVTSVIVAWNAHMLYSKTPNSSQAVLRTPSRFAMEILQVLDIKAPEGNYWDDLQQGIVKPFTFKPSEQLRALKPQLNKLYKFRTHATFDKFVCSLNDEFTSKKSSQDKIDEDYFSLRLHVDFNADYLSLRFIDLAFWMHYYAAVAHKKPDTERFLPVGMDEDVEKGNEEKERKKLPLSHFSRCPFGVHPAHHYLRQRSKLSFHRGGLYVYE